MVFNKYVLRGTPAAALIYNAILVVVDRLTKMANYNPTKTTIGAMDVAKGIIKEITITRTTGQHRF